MYRITLVTLIKALPEWVGKRSDLKRSCIVPWDEPETDEKTIVIVLGGNPAMKRALNRYGRAGQPLGGRPSIARCNGSTILHIAVRCTRSRCDARFISGGFQAPLNGDIERYESFEGGFPSGVNPSSPRYQHCFVELLAPVVD
jgi:hypothetical protein